MPKGRGVQRKKILEIRILKEDLLPRKVSKREFYLMNLMNLKEIFTIRCSLLGSSFVSMSSLLGVKG
jgi:hypothetical protein